MPSTARRAQFRSGGDPQQPERSGDTGVLEIRSEPVLKRPQRYRVVLLNDDYTPMEFVVAVLQSVFGFDPERATRVMLAVHTQGKGACGIFTREVAETRAATVTELARQNEHPLLCEIEPVDEDEGDDD